MRQKATRELFAYWDKLRRGRPAPERVEVDPAAVRHILADTFMLEADASETFPFRLSGTRINALFDTELKGRSFIDLWRGEKDASMADNMAALLRSIIEDACPVVAKVSAGPRGYQDAEFELLLLPLRHNGKTQARIMGLIAPVKQPAWFGLLPVEKLVLRGLRTLNEDKAPEPPKTAPRWPDFSLGTSLYEQRGHLRIYEGGRHTNPLSTEVV